MTRNLRPWQAASKGPTASQPTRSYKKRILRQANEGNEGIKLVLSETTWTFRQRTFNYRSSVNALPGQGGHSAQVKMRLLVNGASIFVAKMGSDFLLVNAPVNHPNGDAIMILHEL